MSTFGLTTQGFMPMQFQDVLNALVSDLQGTFGSQFALETTSPEAQLAAAFSDGAANVWAACEASYNAFYPNTASGTSLDNVATITGLTRLPAAASQLPEVSIYGTSGTVVPSGFLAHVGNAPASQFGTTVSGTISATALNTTFTISFATIPVTGTWELMFGVVGNTTSALSYNVTAAALQAAMQACAYPGTGGILVTGDVENGFTCTYAGANAGLSGQIIPLVEANSLEDVTSATVTPLIQMTELGGNCAVLPMTATTTGPIQAPPFTLNQIDTPIVGVSQVVNYNAATLGQNVETDAALRLRRSQLLQRSSAGNLEAIRSAILNDVPGVTACSVAENVDTLPDGAGRPGKSFECIVQGGTDLAVATQIFLSKPAGIEAWGNTFVNVTDSMGNVHSIGFSRATAVVFYIAATITTNTNSGLGPIYPADGDQAVAATIAALGLLQISGQWVIPTQYIGAVVAAVPGIIGITLAMDVVSPPTNTANYPLTAEQIASISLANITVAS